MKRRKTGGRAQWRREGEGEHTVKLRNSQIVMVGGEEK